MYFVTNSCIVFNDVLNNILEFGFNIVTYEKPTHTSLYVYSNGLDLFHVHNLDQVRVN